MIANCHRQIEYMIVLKQNANGLLCYLRSIIKIPSISNDKKSLVYIKRKCKQTSLNIYYFGRLLEMGQIHSPNSPKPPELLVA